MACIFITPVHLIDIPEVHVIDIPGFRLGTPRIVTRC
jgi:hypothetical protein